MKRAPLSLVIAMGTPKKGAAKSSEPEPSDSDIAGMRSDLGDELIAAIAAKDGLAAYEAISAIAAHCEAYPASDEEED